MRINLFSFRQKYLWRPMHRLAHDYRIATIIVGALFLPGAITLIVLHPQIDNLPLFITQLSLLVLGLFSLPAVFMLEELYEGDYDYARNMRIARRLVPVLNKTGKVPFDVLKQHYDKRHIFKLPIDVDDLVVLDYTKHLFEYDYRQQAVAAREQTEPERNIPYPDGGDYRAAYYQTYARLRAIREHPELATVQDSLIDDLYGVG